MSYQGATPKREEVAKELGTKVKADANLVDIRKIDNKFGETSAIVTAHVYESAEKMTKIMPKEKKKTINLLKTVFWKGGSTYLKHVYLQSNTVFVMLRLVLSLYLPVTQILLEKELWN